MKKADGMFTPLQELERVLSPELAQGVVDHRKAKRAPLTALAARLLAREFEKCADPDAGAEAMLLNGWQGFKAEWVSRAASSNRIDARPLRGTALLAEELRLEIENAGREAGAEGADHQTGEQLRLGSRQFH